MCNPIIFKCLSCGLRHLYKPQPCAGVRKHSATMAPGGFTGGAPLRLCAGAKMHVCNVSCEPCKDAWNARQRESRRREARRVRAASRSRQGTVSGRV